MSITLTLDGTAVASYENGEDMPVELSPRPYLQHVRTIGGVEVTQTHTEDHHHHYGVSLALPDVGGTSYWGGRTYVRGSGSTLLDNHGREVRTGIETTDVAITESLDFIDENGALQLTEVRHIAVMPAPSGWILSWRSALTAVADVSFGSPDTNGRDGAFYGGLFWRMPFSTATAITDAGTGTELAHGSIAPWLAISTATCTVIAASADGLPWFLRTEDYVGFGPALARGRRRSLAGGATLELSLDVLVADESSVTPDRAAELAKELAR